MWTRGLFLLLLAGLLAAAAPAAQEVPASEPPPGETVSPSGPPGTALPGGDDEGEGEEGEEEAQTRRGYLATSLALGAARDEGFRVGEDDVEDTIYLAVPTLLGQWRASERTELSLAYEGEVERFERNSDLDGMNHAAGALYRHEASRRSVITFGGSFVDGQDPGRHLGGQLLILPRSPFEQLRAYGGFEQQIGKASVLLQVGRTRTRIEPGAGLLESGLDQTEDSAVAAWLRPLGSQTDLTVSYSLVRPTRSGEERGDEGADGAGLAPVADRIQTAVLGLARRIGSHLLVDVAAGVLRELDESSLLAGAGIERRGGPFTLYLRYDRSLVSLGPAPTAPGGAAPQVLPPTAALGDSLSQTASAGFAARLGDHLRWEQRLWASRTELPASEALKSGAVASRLVVLAGRRLGVFGQFDYFEQRGAGDSGDPLTRTRYALGLVLGLSGPSSAWDLGEGSTLARSLLPRAR